MVAKTPADLVRRGFGILVIKAFMIRESVIDPFPFQHGLQDVKRPEIRFFFSQMLDDKWCSSVFGLEKSHPPP